MKHIPELKISVGKTTVEGSRRVWITFGMDISELALLPQQAIDVAKSIIRSAKEILVPGEDLTANKLQDKILVETAKDLVNRLGPRERRYIHIEDSFRDWDHLPDLDKVHAKNLVHHIWTSMDNAGYKVVEKDTYTALETLKSIADNPSLDPEGNAERAKKGLE